MDRALLDIYLARATAVHDATQGLSREQLLSMPIPGTWSIQQIALHLVDSDLVISDRMKRVIAEESPPLIGYDESLFAKHLFYEEADVAQAAQLFELNRRHTHAILTRLPDAAFTRVGLHSERGPLTLEQLLRGGIDHLEGHMVHARKKRAMVLGNP